MKTVVFLGGGRITSAMVAGLRLREAKYRLVVHDRNPGKLRALKKRYRITAEPDLRHALDQADMLIVAVRPDAVRSMLQSIGKLEKPLLAISLAAGVPLKALSRMLGAPARWVRAMPSPASRRGRGLAALAFSRSVPLADRKRVREFFGALGGVIEVPEKNFDAFTVTYSSSHGYHALAALAFAAEAHGLDRKTALLASAHALADGIVAWREGSDSLQNLLDEAATPGGIAAATMAAMDAAGYTRSVRNGIRAGLRRTRANARL